jgi:hypothetical protein
VKQTLRTLLSGAIDYAGLFPPEKLDMATSMRNYAGYLSGPRAWALGRFVVPVSRLEEFNFHIGDIESGGKARDVRLSAVIGHDVEGDFEKVGRFNRWHAERDRRLAAVIDAVDVKAAFPDTVMRVSQAAPDSLTVFFEVPVEQDTGELVSAIAHVGGAAKARTGGGSPDMFPPAQRVVRLLGACLEAGVPFKATGGLHYPLRGVRPVSNGADAPKTVMYGFLNLLLCAAFMYDGIGAEEAVGVLTEESADGFFFDDEGVVWRNKRVTIENLAAVRRDFALSFGSASFEEPMDHLGGLDPE